jgi:D-serine deaminase-like pyridoxal phosphate-dependent protein
VVRAAWSGLVSSAVVAAAEPSPSPQLTPARRADRYARALGDRDAPLALLDLDALRANAAGMRGRAGGTPIRIASKSLRCRPLVERILREEPGYRGILAFTLPEALWLHEHGADDLLVAYPTADRAAIAALARRTAEAPDGAPIVMVDGREQLDLLAAAAGPDGPPLRVCLDLDASFRLVGGRLAIGPKRSPLHAPAEARAMAEEIAARPRFRLVAIMSYEGHIAGVGDRPPGAPLKGAVLRRLQRASYRELRERRAEAVALVREVAPIEIVNVGGTGDLHLAADEPAITELTAGSGFYAPTLFDAYAAFRLEPAALFALPVVRRPGPGVVTALGGGYLASGVGAADRMPQPYLPPGLSLDGLEGAGEVQTPLRGRAADALAIGDRVFLRHAKAGELCERFDRLLVIEGDAVVDELPTYRGEGRTFL